MTENMTIDLLVVGSGTGLAAALSAHEQGAEVLVIEKTGFVGGSTARSGGAFWIPANPVLDELGANDSPEKAREYLTAVVDGTSPEARWESFLEHGPDTVRMLERTTRMQFTWAEGYSDYHPELPGGSPAGRSCECRPFDVARLGTERARLRPAVMEAPLPMPVTGADYKWLNLMAKSPVRGFGVAIKRAIQGIGGKLIGREYAAGGRALAAGLFDGVVRAGIPVWTDASLERLVTDADGAVIGAVVTRDGREITITARRGVVLAAGGFDHDLALRRSLQSASLEDWSLGSDGNTGDAIRAAQELGAGVALMDQAWWFPAISPLPGERPIVMLAERSLPGSFIVDALGRTIPQRGRGLHVVRPRRARAGARGPAGRHACGSSSTRSTATATCSAARCSRAWRCRRPGTSTASPCAARRGRSSPSRWAFPPPRWGRPPAGSTSSPRRVPTPTSAAATAPTTATTATRRSHRTRTSAR